MDLSKLSTSDLIERVLREREYCEDDRESVSEALRRLKQDSAALDQLADMVKPFPGTCGDFIVKEYEYVRESERPNLYAAIARRKEKP